MTIFCGRSPTTCDLELEDSRVAVLTLPSALSDPEASAAWPPEGSCGDAKLPDAALVG